MDMVKPGHAQAHDAQHRPGSSFMAARPQLQYGPLFPVRKARIHRADSIWERMVARAASLTAHVEHKNKNGVQYNVGNRRPKHGHHTHGPEALGVDEAVHAQTYHDKDIAHEDRWLRKRPRRKWWHRWPEQIQHGPLEHQSGDRQQDPPRRPSSQRNCP